MEQNSVEVVAEMTGQWKAQFEELSRELTSERNKADAAQRRIAELSQQLTAIDGALQAGRAIQERLATPTPQTDKQ